MATFPIGNTEALAEGTATENAIGTCQRAVDDIRDLLTKLEDRLALVLESHPPGPDTSVAPKACANTILADRIQDLKDRLYATSARLGSVIDRIGL